jgi:hypothetical protein
MKEVYAGSSLNLAVTFSKDGNGGLFRSRDPTAVVPCIARSLDFNIMGFMISDQLLLSDSVVTSHLLARAWVIQELFLAPRTLSFGESQLLWECHAGCTWKSQPWDPKLNPNQLGNTLPTSRLSGFISSWDGTPALCSNASLTFPSDKLVALSGIAKHLSEKGFGTYVAGLWRDGLEHQLPWETDDGKCGTRPSPYRAPSWSWAAPDGVRVFSYESMEERQFQRWEMLFEAAIDVFRINVQPKSREICLEK